MRQQMYVGFRAGHGTHARLASIADDRDGNRYAPHAGHATAVPARALGAVPTGGTPARGWVLCVPGKSNDDSAGKENGRAF